MPREETGWGVGDDMGHPQVAPPRAPGSSVSAQTASGGDWNGLEGTLGWWLGCAGGH